MNYRDVFGNVVDGNGRALGEPLGELTAAEKQGHAAAQLVAQIADILYRANERAVGEPGIGRSIYTREARAAVLAFVAQAVAAERAACLAIARTLGRTTYWDDPSAGIAAQIERRGEVAQPDTAGQIAERARCARIARRCKHSVTGAYISCEEIAQAIERGEG